MKLVCVLLETVGMYFDKGTARIKMDRFLIFFMRYILKKGELPMPVEFYLADTFEIIRPKMKRMTTVEECDAAILKILADERDNLNLDKPDHEDDERELYDESTDSEDDSDSDSDSDEDDSDEDSDDDSSSDEDEYPLEGRPGPRPPTPEDKLDEDIDEFEREMQAMMIESLTEQNRLLKKATQPQMPVLTPSANKTDSPEVQPGFAGFRFMHKKDGKKAVQVKQLVVPESSKLASAQVNDGVRRQQEEDERRALKSFVLDYESTKAEEEHKKLMQAQMGAASVADRLAMPQQPSGYVPGMVYSDGKGGVKGAGVRKGMKGAKGQNKGGYQGYQQGHPGQAKGVGKGARTVGGGTPAHGGYSGSFGQ